MAAELDGMIFINTTFRMRPHLQHSTYIRHATAHDQLFLSFESIQSY